MAPTLTTQIFVAYGLTAAGGCTPRAIPLTWPTKSVLSSSASEGCEEPRYRALSEEPPLPGEPQRGWFTHSPGAEFSSHPVKGENSEKHKSHHGQHHHDR